MILLWCSCTAVYAFDTASFLDMTKEQQTFYLLGIIDSEILHLPANEVYCVLQWAREDMHMYLSDWYETHAEYQGEVSIAFVVGKELDIVCNRGNKAS